MRKIKEWLAAASTALLLVLGLLVLAPPANADENDSPDPCSGVDTYSGNGNCYDVVRDESTASAEASTDVTDVAVNGVDIHSKVTVVAYVKAKGMPKSQQTKCFRTKKPMKLWTSYVNTSGQEVWHWKSYPAGKKFCKGKDGWYHDTVCYNKVKIKHPSTPPPGIKVYGKIKIVKKFNFSAKALAQVNDKVTAKAKAWANTTSCHAEASAKGAASFYAYAKATFKGSVLVKVIETVKGMANDRLNIKLEGASLVDIHGKTKAKAGGEATATASAKAVCEDVPPPPDACPNIPGPQEPGYNCYPPEGEIVQWPAHLYPGGTYRAKVVGSDVEDKGNVTLEYNVTGGASIVKNDDYPTICDVEGGQKVCTFWIKAGAKSGVNATLTLTVKDTGGLTSPTYSKTWPIVPDEF